MKLLVTGGSGFLGSHVIPLLASRGHDVRAIARSDQAASKVRSLGASPISADLDAPESLRRAFTASGADVLVNIASLGFGHADMIVTSALEAKINRALFVSTTAIFTSLNASSKATRKAAEEAIINSHLAWTILRPTMIYGTPKDRNMWRLLQLLRRSPLIPIPGSGDRLQQPVHVDDVATAIVSAAERDHASHRAYSVAGPTAMTFRQVIGEAAQAVGRQARPIALPAAPVIKAVRVYERLSVRPRLKAEQIERLLEDKAFDIADAVQDLGYEPRSFAVGIRQEAAFLS